MSFFEHTITDLDGWAAIFQNAEAFTPLVRHILDLHGLPQTAVENTTPGSHAVFRAGDCIVKIFAPDTFGWPCESDFVTEIAAMRYANCLGIAVPELIAHGRLEDSYSVRYLIQRFIRGTEFGKKELSPDEQCAVGKQLREICGKMNRPCAPFNDYDFLEGARMCTKWERFPESFRRERLDFLRTYSRDEAVYVHGDIHIDNAVYGEDGQVWILDFADSISAPAEYEYAALFPGLFRLRSPYFDGFYGAGQWSAGGIADVLVRGLCIHKFGAEIIRDIAGDCAEIGSLAALKRLLVRVIGCGGTDGFTA